MRIHGFLVAVLLATISLGGCSKSVDIQTENKGEFDETSDAELDEFCEEYGEIYADAASSNEPGSIGMVQALVAGLGDAGYVAIDLDNQVDMANNGEMLDFIDKVEAHETWREYYGEQVSGDMDWFLSDAAGLSIFQTRSSMAYKLKLSLSCSFAFVRDLIAEVITGFRG